MYLLPLQAALGKKDENVLEMICSYVVHSPIFNPLLVPLPSTTASCPAHLCEQPALCGYPYSSGDLSAEELQVEDQCPCRTVLVLLLLIPRNSIHSLSKEPVRLTLCRTHNSL